MRLCNHPGLCVGLAFALGCFTNPLQAASQEIGPAAARLPVSSPVGSSNVAAEVQDAQPEPQLVQASSVTLADLVEACAVDPGPALGRFFCNETVGAVGDAVEARCVALRQTGQINCDAAGPYAALLSALSASCEWANDPVFKDRLGNPMRGRTIACR